MWKKIGWQAAAVIAGNLFGAVAGSYLFAKFVTWIPWAGAILLTHLLLLE